MPCHVVLELKQSVQMAFIWMDCHCSSPGALVQFTPLLNIAFRIWMLEIPVIRIKLNRIHTLMHGKTWDPGRSKQDPRGGKCPPLPSLCPLLKELCLLRAIWVLMTFSKIVVAVSATNKWWGKKFNGYVVISELYLQLNSYDTWCISTCMLQIIYMPMLLTLSLHSHFYEVKPSHCLGAVR